MSHIVEGLINLPPWFVLLFAFLLPAAEASIFIGVVVPGEIAIIVAGVVAHGGHLPLWSVILVGTLGAVIGDSIGYEVGARYGDRLLAKLPERIVKPEHIDQGRALLRRRGAWAVLVGRFTAALRALIPGLAGTSRLPYRTFLPFNVLGGLLWVTMSALIGYIAGASYKSAEHKLSLISGGLLAVIVLAILYKVVHGSERAQAWFARHRNKLPGHAVTWSAVLLVGAGWLLGGLVQHVTEHRGPTAFDTDLLRDVVDRREGWLTGLSKVVTALGTDGVAYGLLVVLGGLVAWRTGSWWLPVGALVWLAAGQAVRLGMSETLERAHPPASRWLVEPGGFSFPSGHATTATIAFGLAAVLALRLLPPRRLTAILAVLIALVLAAAVGATGVYLGVHWPTDVVAGWSLGLGWLALAATVSSAYQRITRGAVPAPEGIAVLVGQGDTAPSGEPAAADVSPSTQTGHD